MLLLIATVATWAVVGDLPTIVETVPRLDFVDEICTYDWVADSWGCDAERIARLPVETHTLTSGIAPISVRPLRSAVGADGRPALLEPEQRGQDPDNWGPKPTWVCISGLELTLPDEIEISWEKAVWRVNGANKPAILKEGSDAVPDQVQTSTPPCVGPRLLFQSDEQLHIEFTVPYSMRGKTSSLFWSYKVERSGLDERTAMSHVTPPRRWRGRIPEAPKPRTFSRMIPVGSCLGATASLMAVSAVAVGQPQAGAPHPTLLATAAYAAAFIPLVAGMAIDATTLAIWVGEGIQHFRYDIALGTLRHWDRSRNAYEARMRELGLQPPQDH